MKNPIPNNLCRAARGNVGGSGREYSFSRQICIVSSTLPRAALHKLLEFATKKSHFLFDNQYYDPIPI